MLTRVCNPPWPVPTIYTVETGGKKWLVGVRRLLDGVHRGKNAGGLLKGKCSDTHPLTHALSPPLHLARRELAFANMSHAKNSSPDVEALGKINRKGTERKGKTLSFL